LAFLRSSGDSSLNDKDENITMIFPLYDEEVHVLASQSIRTFSCLQGKKVAVGAKGSGSSITASLLFKKSGVIPDQIIYLDAETALDQLRSKKIDAMIYVAGYPVSLFSQITARDELHLVPITDRKIGPPYIMSSIPARTYRWQENIVSTIAVKAVLAGYSYEEDDPASQKACDIGKIIYSNIDWLKQNGHQKWHDVRWLYDELQGWEKNVCVDNAVKKIISSQF
ncbi:MAG: TAXI family TRAP transporter solute-binding subunit, partial [Candidatus Electrothrix sp. ATG2]|nr:TAXI family TRAP transporter solute-binding subunit [Candidatus Electrothrix sp. ATG2]